jgi:hypothetical protein
MFATSRQFPSVFDRILPQGPAAVDQANRCVEGVAGKGAQHLLVVLTVAGPDVAVEAGLVPV